MPDKCWHCGYDLAELHTGVCPECGAKFVTGKDLEHLHDTLVGGDDEQCKTCGTPRPSTGVTRCPTCGIRYGRSGQRARDEGVDVQGVMSRPAVVESRPERERNPGTPVVLLIAGLGFASAIGLIVLANSVSGSLSLTGVNLIKGGALVLALWSVGWLIWRLARRDVQTLKGQLERGPRGWSHRVVGKCPRCGYDMKGLGATRCPECGLERPSDAGR